MDDTADLLASLQDHGIRLWMEGEELRYQAPKRALTPEWRARLMEKKTEIVELLSRRNADVGVHPSTIASTNPGALSRESPDHYTDRVQRLKIPALPPAVACIPPYWELKGIPAPWEVRKVEYDIRGRRLEYHLEWLEEELVRCPACGAVAERGEHISERTWRRVGANIAIFLHARVPRFSCRWHGEAAVTLPWSESNQFGEIRQITRVGSATRLISSSRERILASKACWSTCARARRRFVSALDSIRRPLIFRAVKQSGPNTAITLPFERDPPYKTWHLLGAHPLSILGAVCDLQPLLASEYINLSCSAVPFGNLIGVSIVPSRPIGRFVLSGHCELADISDRPRFIARNARRLVEWFIEKLRCGWYCLLHVNKFYVPGSWAYKKNDYLHDCLLIGVDVRERTFKLAMYVEPGEYGTTDVPFDQFVLGLISRGGSFLQGDGICYEPSTLAVRPRSGIRFQFEVEAACRHLKNYLQSQPPIDRIYVRDDAEYAGDWSMGPGYPRAERCYGLAVFVQLIANIRNLIAERQPIDMRDMRAFWEHKKIILQNLSFWNEQGRIADFTALHSSYQGIVTWAYKLHLLCFAYNQPNSASTDCLLSHVAYGEDLCDLEKPILSQILLELASSHSGVQ